MTVTHLLDTRRMAHRYRMYPTAEQAPVMVEWCGQARFVWNLALEQASLHRSFGRYADQRQWNRMLAELRGEVDWLAAGSSHVQQQALRDLRQAFRNWWGGTHRHPTPRKHGQAEGFGIRELSVAKINRKWATVHVPKVGPVRFRLSRPLPDGTKSARVSQDLAGRWHISFVAIPMQIAGPESGEVVGVDRGVKTSFACSQGRHFQTRGLSPAEQARKKRLLRRLARQTKGSERRQRTKHRIARLAALEADRRRDSVEFASTSLARRFDIVRIEDLRVKQMTRSAKGTVDEPGVNVRAKAGLNRAILSQGWALFARRLKDKIGDRLELVPAAYTSQRCSVCGHVDPESRESQARFECTACGYTANADVNAACNIAAGRAVTGRGGNRAIRRPNEASSTLVVA